MKIKERVFDKGCKTCGLGAKIVSEEVYGCDKCKKEISSPFDKERNYLETTIFYEGDREPQHLRFCSWKCVFAFVKTMQKTKFKCDSFMTLPYVIFRDKSKMYSELLKEIKGSAK